MIFFYYMVYIIGALLDYVSNCMMGNSAYSSSDDSHVSCDFISCLSSSELVNSWVYAKRSIIFSTFVSFCRLCTSNVLSEKYVFTGNPRAETCTRQFSRDITLCPCFCHFCTWNLYRHCQWCRVVHVNGMSNKIVNAAFE